VVEFAPLALVTRGEEDGVGGWAPDGIVDFGDAWDGLAGGRGRGEEGGEDVGVLRDGNGAVRMAEKC